MDTEMYATAVKLFIRLLKSRLEDRGTRLTPGEVEVITYVLDETLYSWAAPEDIKEWLKETYNP